MADEIKGIQAANTKSKAAAKEVLIREEISGAVNEMTKKKFDAVQFETKEEYIKFLLENHEGIIESSQKHDDQKIHLNGRLVIDNRVKSGLDWSDVISDSAIVINGKITKTEYLPQTRFGIKTSLPFKNAEEYMKHNACEVPFDGKSFQVDGILRITGGNMPDLSTVCADKILCYGNEKYELNKLPRAKAGFFGLNAEQIIAHDGDNAKTAQEKGLSKAICKSFKTPSLLKKLCDNFGQKKSGSNGAA